MLGSVKGLQSAFCSYQLKTNFKSNIDCLLGRTIGGFSMSSVELGLGGFLKQWGRRSAYIKL